MWHRFEPALRTAVLRTLEIASARGKTAAGSDDLAAAALQTAPDAQAAKFLKTLVAAESASNRSGSMVNELAPDAIDVLESAYHEAAESAARQVTIDHLTISLFGKTQANGATATPVERVRSELRAAAPVVPATPGMDEATRQARIYEDLSAIHPGFSIDPYPLYAQLRSVAPVRRDPVLPVWVVTGYEEVLSILRDPRFTVQRKQSRTQANSYSIDVLPDGPVRRQLGILAGVLAKKMIFLDPPEHTRVRNLMNQNFTPKAVEAMRPRIQAIADELLDAAIAAGKIDLILDFALQLPIIVICEMIGFPTADRLQLKKWADAVGLVLVLGCTIEHELEARRAMIDMRGWFDGIMDGVRKDPSKNDLLSIMVRSGYPANEEEQAELFSNCVFLLGAGHETTTSLIGNGVRILKSHPDQLEMLLRDPKLIATTVEELLRFESPVQWTSRQAREDATIGGVTIKAGESVLLSLGAANRDPRQFKDPDTLDITRKEAYRHLAFSGGIHFCMGAALSRVEAQVGIPAMLRRLPGLRIEPEPLRWKHGGTIRTLESLPAAF